MEELITYFPFTVIWVSHASRKEALVCMHNEVNKTIQFWRPQCWYYWLEWFMKHAIEMASGDMIYIISFMEIGSGIQEILRVLPQQFERV
jgi:hypothetical protein